MSKGNFKFSPKTIKMIEKYSKNTTVNINISTNKYYKHNDFLKISF